MKGIKAWLGDFEGAVTSLFQCFVNEAPVQEKEPVMGLGGEIEVQVHDKDGKLIRAFKQPMHTFVDNAAACLMTAFTMACDAVAGFSIVNVSGVSKTVAYQDQDATGDYCVVAGSGVPNFGILVGTSATAWAWSQYFLQGFIDHGTVTGKLSYGATTRSYVADGGAPAKCTIQRSFDNNSGADITVREIGWFMKALVAAVPEYWMLARDVITSTTVPNGGRLTVTYNVLVNPT